MEDDFKTRLTAIEQKLEGESVSSICKSLQCSRAWFYKWYNRYEDQGIEGLKSLSKVPHTLVNKTDPDIESKIIMVRQELQGHDSNEMKYAYIGADSIQWELEHRGLVSPEQIPSITTINRILKRNNLIKKKALPKRLSLPYPRPIINHPNSVHQLDTVGPRYINGKNGVERFYCINLIDCYSKITCKTVCDNTQSTTILDFLINDVWSTIGIPRVLQVDNMLAIKGSNKYPRTMSMIMKWCLYLGIELLFIPIKEPQRNGFVEKSNHKFEVNFFGRQRFDSLLHLKEELQIYQQATNERFANPTLKKQIHGARTPYDVHFKDNVILPKNVYDITNRLRRTGTVDGKISYIRFIQKDCKLNIFSESFELPAEYRYTYVKATLNTKTQMLTIANEDHVHTIGYSIN